MNVQDAARRLNITDVGVVKHAMALSRLADLKVSASSLGQVRLLPPVLFAVARHYASSPRVLVSDSVFSVQFWLSNETYVCVYTETGNAVQGCCLSRARHFPEVIDVWTHAHWLRAFTGLADWLICCGSRHWVAFINITRHFQLRPNLWLI